MAASANRPAQGLELLGLGSLLEVALVRVPLADHGSLGGTCRTLRRLILTDKFERLRKMLGATEYGLLVVCERAFDLDDEGVYVRNDISFMCPTHNLRELGFTHPEEEIELCECTAACSSSGRLVICGDANSSQEILVYDIPSHASVQDSRLPRELPVVMYGQCTAFLENTLVVVAGGTCGATQPWGFSWDEQSRLWRRLPSIPSAVVHPAYCVIGSRLFVVGGYCDEVTQPETYKPGNLCTFTTRLQIYDGAKRSWSLGTPLTALKDKNEIVATAVAHNGCVYVFAHADDPGSVDDGQIIYDCHCYVYNPRSEVWSELPDLPVEHSFMVACVHDGRLVVVGSRVGYDNGPYPQSIFMYELDEQSGTWRRKSMLIDDVESWPRAGPVFLASFPLR